MRKNLILLLFPFLLWATAAYSAPSPVATIVDNFEIYAGTPEMADAWKDYAGAPTQTLSDVAHAGARSMRIEYSVGRDPFVNWVKYKLPAGTDWSEMVVITIWYQGLESNSADNLSLQLLNGSNVVLFQKNLPGATGNPGWNRWDVNLSSAAAKLTAVDSVVVGVEASVSALPGQGTIYVDDISVTNGLKTVWIGTTVDWNDAANWTAGVPSTTTDAVVPARPGGGQMPVIQARGAQVHDLQIAPNAILDQTNNNLNVTGTLDNQGALLRTKSMGSDVAKPFLVTGGHPGVVISTGAATTGAARTEANLALGPTKVGITGGRTCIGGGGSIARCYTITPTNEAPADVTFYFNQDDMQDQVCEDLALYNFRDNSWQKIAGPGDDNIEHQCGTANYSVTVRGITDYAPFLLSDSVPSAISLESFTAAPGTSLSPLIIAAGLLALTALIVLRRG